MIRTAVIGAGAWGTNLIRNIAANPDMELVAVCDPDGDARKRVSTHYPETMALRGIDALLELPGLDAIVVATPPQLHHVHARAALEAGYHVLVETPLCTTSCDARELVELAEESALTLMVGHTYSYNNLLHEVKRRIDAGELGEVRYIHSQRLGLGRLRQDVDVLWGLAPHDIAIASYLLGDRPTQVNARGANCGREAADVCLLQMDYTGGQMVSGHVSRLEAHKVRRTVVVGSERTLVYDDLDTSRHIQVFDRSKEAEFQAPLTDYAEFATCVCAGDAVISNIKMREPLAVEIEHFAACARTGRTPLTDGRAGLQLVCTLEALAQSMDARGALVEVDYRRAVTRSAASIAISATN
ncbi:MAG: Gfo/Idh/MocA family oxidoreductase [Phycisphaerales bacterium]|nr:Gfo/Idh/MocA family oxidoreductase [Phycisphaerales bacterium]